MTPLPTSCPVMRSLVSEGKSVKCQGQGGAERDVESSGVGVGREIGRWKARVKWRE